METKSSPSVPPWDRPVFIITTGRTGSTLLLRYLNCAENVVIWGEHAGILKHLAECHAKLTSATTLGFIDAARPWLPHLLSKTAVVCAEEQMTLEWVNSFDRARIREACRRFLFDLLNGGLPAGVRWGFKEIHYTDAEVALLRALFDEPRFLLLVRDPVAVLTSKFTWFAGRDPRRMRPHVDETLAYFAFAAREVAARPPDVQLVHYEQLAAAPTVVLDRVAAFIGARLKADQVEAIAAERAAAPTPPEGELADRLQAALDAIGIAVERERVTELAGCYRALVAADSAVTGAGAPPESLSTAA